MRDGGWPSEDGLQDQFSNRPTLRGDKSPGGERIGKSRGAPRQVGARKANASEPLMSCRNTSRRDRNQALLEAWDKVQRKPADGLDDRRQRDGASLVQAFMRNVGTWRSDAKGDVPEARTLRTRVPMQSAGADQLVVAMKPGNAGGAKGLNCPAAGVRQPARGGAHG